jgi:lipoprotein
MKNIILLIGIFVGIWMMSCHDITVGYLSTENAGYDPDTMVVRQALKTDSVKNSQWEMYLDIAQDMWEIMGYNSPEECVEYVWGITEYTYEEDYDRWRFQIPWLSTKLQGVNGTQQVYMRIKDVTSDRGNAEAMLKVLSVRGDGMLRLPTDVSSIPEGRYVVSLNIYNEGYSQDVNDVFTIIVE